MTSSLLKNEKGFAVLKQIWATLVDHTACIGQAWGMLNHCKKFCQNSFEMLEAGILHGNAPKLDFVQIVLAWKYPKAGFCP